jgi:hypothetical protein
VSSSSLWFDGSLQGINLGQTPKACPLIEVFCMNMQKTYKCNRLLEKTEKTSRRRFVCLIEGFAPYLCFNGGIYGE